MDSGNSGILQSSSDGEEEHDSRAAAVDHHLMPSHTSFFHPFPNNLSHNSPNHTWLGSIPFRSDPSPNSQTLLNPFMPSFHTTESPPPPPPPRSDNAANPAAISMAARNPRKRSRASRRAPTTVLTTDTTNFRAMVQEFTGIPASPFTASPSFPRPNRLDNLFNTRSSGAGSMEASTTVPPYLRRPFAQGDPTPPFFLSTSDTNNTTSATSNINYQQLSFSNSNSNNLLRSINTNFPNNNDDNSNNNNQNPNPIFTSLLQTNPSNFVFSASSAMASKPTFDFQLGNIKTGSGLDAFGMGVGLGVGGARGASAINDLPSLVSLDHAAARNDRENNEDIEDDNDGGGYDQARMKPIGLDFSCPTSSGFHGEKGPENSTTTTRVGDQGMVESWIFSSE